MTKLFMLDQENNPEADDIKLSAIFKWQGGFVVVPMLRIVLKSSDLSSIKAQFWKKCVSVVVVVLIFHHKPC